MVASVSSGLVGICSHHGSEDLVTEDNRDGSLVMVEIFEILMAVEGQIWIRWIKENFFEGVEYVGYSRQFCALQ